MLGLKLQSGRFAGSVYVEVLLEPKCVLILANVNASAVTESACIRKVHTRLLVCQHAYVLTRKNTGAGHCDGASEQGALARARGDRCQMAQAANVMEFTGLAETFY
jgi:predicted short-subunit dehydrogenase-like oxidoreductase (DUF2520 family)